MKQKSLVDVFRKQYVYILILSMLCLFNVLTPSYTEAANHAKTVKVGYMEDYGFSIENKEVQAKGYVYEYLLEVSKYVDWKYEFIPVNWGEGLEKLAAGEIDLFGPLQYREERAEEFQYPRYDIGYEYGMLYTDKDNNELFHNDFKAFNGMKVGIISGDYFFEGFKKYAKENHFSVEYVVYDDVQTLMKGLSSNQVEAIAVGGNANVKNAKIIGTFEVAPVYMVTTKGNSDITKELNLAIQAIKLQDVSFDNRLYHKYNKQHFSNISFSREMTEYVKSRPKLRLVYNPNYSPIEYYDEKTKQFKGINADLLEIISKESGIDFEYIKTDSYEESVRYIEEGKADLITGYVESVDSKSFITTNEYNKVPVAMIEKIGASNKDGMQIALTKGHNSTIEYVKKRYKSAEIIIYDSVHECIEALDKGKVDATLVNTYLFDEMARASDYHDLKIVGVSEIVLPMKIGISKQVDGIVQRILNSSINKISQEQIDVSVFANTVNKAYEIPWQKVVKEYSFQLLGLLSVLFIMIVSFIMYNKRKMVGKLKKIAYTDQLTGTRNLDKFRIDAAMLFKKNKPEDYSILYMDVGKFKHINDDFGFKMGNEVLIHIVKCFTEELQADEIFGRVSSDYFIMLIKDDKESEISFRLKRVFKKIQSFSTNQSKTFKITMHCGIYKVKENETDIISMLDKANEARKTLKGGIGNKYAYYTSEMHSRFMKEKLIEESMESALSNDEFMIYLQPKYNLSNRTIVGAEALVRWNHPKEGIIPPTEFIPVFENNNFIISLDFYIFERICQKMREWLDVGYKPIPISVNVSRIHLGTPDFTSRLIDLIRKYKIPPYLMELEITETTFIDNIDLLVKIIKELKREGFLISMDDFGTGYSSLDLLKVLPVDVLKLDKSFLEQEEMTFRGKILIGNVISMTQLLDIKIVAEGIETIEQEEFLRMLGCDMGQGYLFSKPISIADFEQLVFGENP